MRARFELFEQAALVNGTVRHMAALAFVFPRRFQRFQRWQ